MKGNDGMIRTGLKYLRDCLKAGPGEAGRRVREKREDARVRAERERTEPLTPEERKAQEAAARKGGVCFRAVFLPGNLSAETEASLRARCIRPRCMSARKGSWKPGRISCTVTTTGM